MMENDIIFLNLHRRYINRKADYGGFLGIYQLAAFLKENGYEAQSFSGQLMEGMKILDEACAHDRTLMVGLYCDYANVTENIFLSHYIKETYGLPVIVGGPQATSLREEFMMKSNCDAVVRYEGELTVLELVQFFIDGSGSLDSMKGIMTMENGKCHIHEERPLIENLDALPLIDDSCYINPIVRRDELDIMTGRGCPFHCAFCHEGHHSRKVRFRSVENVLGEIRCFLGKTGKHRHTYILFTDDTFTLIPARVHAICEGLKKLREKYDFTWYCEGHVHMLYKNPEMIDDLADAGCLRIQLGIESGNQNVLDAYNKGCTLKEIEDVIVHCKNAGIEQIFGNIILGSALATRETYEQDRKFGEHLLRLGQGTVELGVVSYWPLAETSMTEHPEQYGIILADRRFETAADDFPQVRTKELSCLDVSQMLRNLRDDFDEMMREMIINGEVPLKRILSWFPLSRKYKVISSWFQLLSEMPLEFAYYQMLSTGEACRSLEMDTNEFYEAHPLRVISMNENISFTRNGFDIKNLHLSDFEQQVLLYAAGKLSVKEIGQRLSVAKDDKTDIICKLKDALDKLEKAHIILYSKH